MSRTPTAVPACRRLRRCQGATRRPRAAQRWRRTEGFTLLEVLVAVAVLGLALVSLLGLHVRNLALIERDARVTDATLLARALMTEVEVGGFPELGRESGDFESRYPEIYPELRWEREILESPVPLFMREAHIRVFRDGATVDESGMAADEVRLVAFVRR